MGINNEEIINYRWNLGIEEIRTIEKIIVRKCSNIIKIDLIFLIIKKVRFTKLISR